MGFTTEFVKGMVILFQGEPHVIEEKEFYSPAKGGSFTRTKIRNIKTGQIIRHTFRTGEKLETVDIETKSMQYLYADDTNAYFMDPVTFEQVTFSLDRIPGKMNYLQSEAKYLLLINNGEILSIQLPPKIALLVTETSSAVRGNTATNASKEAILETGMSIQVPLFISTNDKIVVNTETGTYVSKET